MEKAPPVAGLFFLQKLEFISYAPDRFDILVFRVDFISYALDININVDGRTLDLTNIDDIEYIKIAKYELTNELSVASGKLE
mgnify:CR=1 FL=1